ncbi:FKBP-type peptidyl-prolyl cis-trans isomerase [Clavibacter michiganensis]|uniref:FKBP-type peptidyl-prolyl cis-trans isomerase n=1 Tax=Clavibacter michiganensis TaxID=28447 RepID=UPI0026DAAA55|nr:FKBP-type peptidyl-prolyl cis-trans isomerase [Clavibacter michiganensis]MDO4042959.1 FKBP-type peptidyl-prolyl cis-trans isomerase [Clavibacter michiganensis]MDO4052470.1 FKBP-type peptidyl-prolyl cis-trans isomerase [Clavibacter michiganensis]
MRRSAALTVCAGLVLTLAACSPSGSSSGAAAGCTPLAQAGTSSSTVTATGDAGSAPASVAFPTPLKPAGVEVSTLVEGDGAPVQPNQGITAAASIVDGKTGKDLADYARIAPNARTTGSPLFTPASLHESLPYLEDAMTCMPVGSRLAVTVPVSTVFPGQDLSSQGLDATDGLVLIVDITSSFPAKATGEPRPAQAGFPSVVTTDDGVPGITIPPSTPPTEYRDALLRAGDGAEVGDGDTVTLQYTGVVWGTSTSAEKQAVFGSSWTGGGPLQVPATATTAAPSTGAASSLVVTPGLAKALVGKHVGDQVIAVVPPAEGFGDQGSAKVPAGSTLVYVVDILGTSTTK